ncbi:hypothetical protein AB6A40_000731 [Gnathostoma spinigerum]|uniref:Uncharacterized protein n=1 Tax=Gnathostoma spinigerum TaxID=75299 RepID=A0ABD6E4R4_9BILA
MFVAAVLLTGIISDVNSITVFSPAGNIGPNSLSVAYIPDDSPNKYGGFASISRYLTGGGAPCPDKPQFISVPLFWSKGIVGQPQTDWLPVHSSPEPVIVETSNPSPNSPFISYFLHRTSTQSPPPVFTLQNTQTLLEQLALLTGSSSFSAQAPVQSVPRSVDLPDTDRTLIIAQSPFKSKQPNAGESRPIPPPSFPNNPTQSTNPRIRQKQSKNLGSNTKTSLSLKDYENDRIIEESESNDVDETTDSTLVQFSNKSPMLRDKLIPISSDVSVTPVPGSVFKALNDFPNDNNVFTTTSSFSEYRDKDLLKRSSPPNSSSTTVYSPMGQLSTKVPFNEFDFAHLMSQDNFGTDEMFANREDINLQGFENLSPFYIDSTTRIGSPKLNNNYNNNVYDNNNNWSTKNDQLMTEMTAKNSIGRYDGQLSTAAEIMDKGNSVKRRVAFPFPPPGLTGMDSFGTHWRKT